MMASNRCLKCGGTILTNYKERTCVNCGAERTTPEWRRQFYQDNKSDMIRDLGSMTEAAVCSKWHIPIQLLSHLKSDGKRLTPRSYTPRQPKPAAPATPATPAAPHVFLTITDEDINCLQSDDVDKIFDVYRAIYLARLHKK